MRRKSSGAEKSRHANFVKKLFLRVEVEWSMSQKLMKSLRTALLILADVIQLVAKVCDVHTT